MVHLGRFFRVTLQVATGRWPGAFRLVGVSGVLELAGLAWWDVGLLRLPYGGQAGEK